MTWAYPRTPFSGETIRFQVLPESVVRYTHGVVSPKVWRSNAANAVALSNRLASTQLTQEKGGSPGTLRVTFCQVFPESRVTWTLPSSVPTQMVFASSGDSLME